MQIVNQRDEFPDGFTHARKILETVSFVTIDRLTQNVFLNSKK